MNIEKLRQLQKFLLEKPERFTMSEGVRVFVARPELWGEGKEDFLQCYDLLEFPSCNTAACLAGEAVLMEDGFPTETPGWFTSVLPRAVEILGLDDVQSERLFYLWSRDEDHYWPTKFKSEYEAAKTPLERVNVAIARIDHFIETEGRE
jgi:hypothetical protein